MPAISAENAEAVYNEPDFANRFPAHVRRLITTTTVLHRELPDEDIEIVDADAIYVNLFHNEAVVIAEVNDLSRGMHWEVMLVKWDRTGGVASERWLGEVGGMELSGYLKVLIERLRREQDELYPSEEGE